jgi:hypothetical protein
MDWNVFLSSLAGFWVGCSLIAWPIAHAKFESTKCQTVDDRIYANLNFWMTIVISPGTVGKALAKLF